MLDGLKAAGRRRGLRFLVNPTTAPNGLFNGLIWPKTGFASTAYAATAHRNFLPLGEHPTR